MITIIKHLKHLQSEYYHIILRKRHDNYHEMS